MARYKVSFMLDGRLLREVVSCTMPDTARKLIEARYPGAHIISVAL